MTLRWFLLFMLFFTLSTPAAAVDNEILSQLRRLTTATTIGTESLHYRRTLTRFYQERQFQPAWSDGRQLLPLADELLSALPAAAEEGLDPRTYHLSTLIVLTNRFRITPTPLLAAELDLLLSDAYLSLSSDYLNGRITPSAVDGDWNIPLEQGDALRMLNQGLASGRIHDSLQALLPTDPAYAALRSAWQKHRDLTAAGGWPRLTFKPPLRPGIQGPEVLTLRRRLLISGDLPALEEGNDIYDASLETAVRDFQSRHGLLADGIVGPQTLTALNVPAVLRVRQLAVNLERWRWLPRRFAERYLRVNLPAFHLDLIENGESILDMRVIVGRQVRQTPAFVGRMTYLVLNPYWEVPHKLAVVDLLPKIQADRSYLAEQGIVVFSSGERRVNPATIDWQQLGSGNFPYHLRQDPGPKNSLGRIKFIFPNSYNIYLHDTPSRKLFEREQRSFSSGCIRIEKPLELARQLLRGSPLASISALEGELQSAVSEVVPLPKPLPVYLVYFTAWVESDGIVHFYPDLYERDQRLDAALRQSN